MKHINVCTPFRYALLLNLPEPTTIELITARMHSRLTVDEAADLCGLHPRSYRRQELGDTRVSLAVYLLLSILAGCMPWPGWENWRMVDGELYAPEDLRHSVTQSTIKSLHWWRMSG